MYEYVKNKEILKYIFELSTNLTNELKIKVNNDKYIRINIEIVGNKNLTMRDSNNPIDVDFNIVVYPFLDEDIDPKKLKDYLINEFNLILDKHNLNECKDQISTIQVLINKDKSYPPFNLNLCIVALVLDEPNRLIHRYKKKIDRHLYAFNKLTSFDEVNKKVELLKEAELFDELRETYKDKRNLYLKRNDLENHPAIVCYIEAVNELFANLIISSMK